MSEIDSFLPIAQRIRDRHADMSAETRARAELYIATLRNLRAAHSCIIRLHRTAAQDLQRRAVCMDVADGLAALHVNALGHKIYKYVVKQ